MTTAIALIVIVLLFVLGAGLGYASGRSFRRGEFLSPYFFTSLVQLALSITMFGLCAAVANSFTSMVMQEYGGKFYAETHWSRGVEMTTLEGMAFAAAFFFIGWWTNRSWR